MLSPSLHIRLIHKKINSFHFFGVIGFIVATSLGVLLCYLLDLEIGIILLMSLTGTATFFLLAILAKIITGGETIVYYHHEIAILIFCSIVLNALGFPILPYIDIVLIGIGVFLGFGRIGCHSVGCCHGRPFHNGIKYGEQHVKAGFTWYYKDIPLLPVQLIESFYVFLVVAAGIILLFNHSAPGTVLLCYTAIYGLMRFMLEFFRGDAERPSWYGLSEAQWTTLILNALTLGMGIMGWLPFYIWHLIIFIILCLISLAIILFYRRNEKYLLFNPAHVKQIAEGLRRKDALDTAASTFGTGFINMILTKQGLCVTCGQHKENNAEIHHYTISTNNNRVIRYSSAKKMAKLISKLKKHHGKVDLIEKQNGIYHILFTQSLS